jgi:nitrous-oxide reductase
MEMSINRENKPEQAQTLPTERRKFLGSAALAGLAGVGVTAGVVGCKPAPAPEAGAPALPSSKPGDVAAPRSSAGSGGALHPQPGQLDEYYGLWSGGHSGEVRVLGMPSGRELMRIPVFAPNCMVGWGFTNESKAIMGVKPDGSLQYTVGDTHHVHASYKDGNYDGRYAWVNDKINARLARIRLDYFTCDKITQLPNVQGFHGIFPDKRDPVDPNINYTTRVFCGGEFHVPLPNDGGGDLADTAQYHALFTCVDAESMEVRWQVLINGNCDLIATSFDGKLAASNQYNTENAALYEDMMSAERDACIFFNIERIEKAVREGRFKTYGNSSVPVVDGRAEVNRDLATALTCTVTVPKNPHGVNASPDGKYFICAGKLSPTVTVIELQKVLDWFDGKLGADADKAIAAEVEVGLGPLHTAFDGRGNAYTTLFLDSQVVKWNVEAAIRYHSGDKNAQYVLDRLDVHYQPGHINASQSETVAADGKWLAVGCKFSKDRFLPVGPLHPENEQIIDISGDKMVLVADHPVFPEPHDFIFFRRDLLAPRQVHAMDDSPIAVKNAADAGVTRAGNKVTVRITSVAPVFSPREFDVKVGDEVTIILTNHDIVEDLTHGFALPAHNINFIVNAQETKSVTFKAEKPGVYWFYCTHFCHALHLEMRGRMLVRKA